MEDSLFSPVDMYMCILVGGLELACYDFPYIENFIIPPDELIFFRGVGIPPTSICMMTFFLHVHIQKFVMSIDRLCVSICLHHFCVQNDNSPENHLRLSAG